MNTQNWYQQSERGASSFRLDLLFWVYKIFGIRFVKFWVWLVATIIGIGAKSAKNFSQQYRQILNEYQIANGIKPSKFSAATHIRTFADSLVDKMVANCDKQDRIKFTVAENSDWDMLKTLINDRTGAFLICSHIGNIEALSAFPDSNNVIMHAFMQTGQNSIFHKFISQRSVRKNTIIHSVEDMGIWTATEMFDFLNKGDLVMMAGDRISAGTPGKTMSIKILGRECKLPMGVFKFAKSMSHPVFAVILLNTGHEQYKLFVKRLDDRNTQVMASEFAEFIEKATLTAPTQWFNFYNFFNL